MAVSNPEAGAILETYNRIGSAAPFGSLPVGCGPQWSEITAAAVRGELSPEQTRDATAMGLELASQLLGERHITAGCRVLSDSRDLAETILSDGRTSLYLQAQAALLWGAVYTLPRLYGDNNNTSRYVAGYREAQAAAVSAFCEALHASDEELPANAHRFAGILGMIVVGHSIPDSGVISLPAPPRCYRGKSPAKSWDLLLWRQYGPKAERATLSAATSLPDVRPLLENQPDSPLLNGAGRLALIETLHAAMQQPEDQPPESAINAVGCTWAALLKLEGEPELNLPPVTDYAAYARLRAPETLIDHPAIDIETFRAGGPDLDKLLEWYCGQTDRRPLTAHEGMLLDRILTEHTRGQSTGHLSFEQLLILNHVRLECATATAGTYPGVTNRQLECAATSLSQLQETALKADDPVSLYRAAIDARRIELLGPGLRGKPLPPLLRDTASYLLDLLAEIDYESKQHGDPAVRRQLEELRLPLLYAALATPGGNSPDMMALPSFGRESGNADSPGWHVNVWAMADGIPDLSAKHRLRFTETGGTENKAGIGIVPLASIINPKTPIDFVVQACTNVAKQRPDPTDEILTGFDQSDSPSHRRTKRQVGVWRTKVGALINAALTSAGSS